MSTIESQLSRCVSPLVSMYDIPPPPHPADGEMARGASKAKKKAHPGLWAFYGCYPSVVQCPGCGHKSTTNHEAFMLNMDPILSRNSRETIPLQQKLQEHFGEDRVEYKCDKCKETRLCAKKLSMSVPPVHLLINVVRWKPALDAWSNRQKAMNPIAFQEVITRPVSVDGVQTGTVKYELTGVLAHQGRTLESGMSCLSE